MKTKLFLALAVVGTLFAALRITGAAEEEEVVIPLIGPDFAVRRLPVGGGVEFRQWHQGEPPVKLIRKEEGFCALTGVGGGFAGSGEQAHVYIGDDGYWYLGGKSMQEGVSAECIIVRTPAAPPAVTRRVNILAACYSWGSEYSDVTARVKKLLDAGESFQADPGSLLVDPHPGWNKALVIVCEVDGKRAMFSVGEGEPVSHDLLVEKAQLIVDPIRTRKDPL